MKSRTRNSALGMLSGSIYYLIYITLGILNRKALVFILGIEYQGANGLFGSVLNILSIAELGIGTAIIYHLYKPIAENNYKLINIIMTFYRKCFSYIALIMLIIGSILSIRLDFFVGENTLSVNLMLVYYLMLADVVASYAFAYKRSILYADQRNYIVANINSLFTIGNNICQVFVLYIFNNYYIYLAVKVIFRIIENIVLNISVNHRYSFLKEKSAGNLPIEILNDIKLKVKGLLFHKISTFVVNGTDNILISKFIGLATVGIYSNYNYIITALNGLAQQIFDATIGSIGNLLVTESNDKCYRVFKELNMFNVLATSIMAAGVYSLSNDFIRLVFKDFLLSDHIIFVLSINMLFTGQRRVFGAYKSAAGIQHEDRYVPICEAIINLVISIILVKRMGIIGVFLGTIVSQFCDYSYTFPIFIFKRIFKRNFWEYLKYILCIFVYQTFAVYSLKIVFNLWQTQQSIHFFVVKGIICVIYELILFCIVWGRNEEFKYMLARIRKALERSNR